MLVVDVFMLFLRNGTNRIGSANGRDTDAAAISAGPWPLVGERTNAEHRNKSTVVWNVPCMLYVPACLLGCLAGVVLGLLIHGGYSCVACAAYCFPWWCFADACFICGGE